MEAFLSWFLDFMSSMLGGFATFFTGIFKGIVQVFNVVDFARIFKSHYGSFGIVDWIFAILAMVFVIAIWALIIFLIISFVKRRIKIKKAAANQEDLFEEIADLHKEIMRLTDEKDKILSMKVAQSGVNARDLANAITSITAQRAEEEELLDNTIPPDMERLGETSANPESGRFLRLSEVDRKYEYYVRTDYVTGFSLEQLCEYYRNFACSRMHLYYNINVIRYMIAGMATTKMILLQGISGTGKTSLPYSMGKFFTHDSTVASVQPSWRDRTELFGYFNEFTKKFNETEVLKRIYEANYNDDMNIIILDEMNIARVEYYFAEMLSILEMPNHDEWKLELVPSSWDNDPQKLTDGKLYIPENLWYIGTANNDDSTFAVSDKVYDRALVINLDAKGEAFEAPDTPPMDISFTYLNELFKKAMKEHAVSAENLDKIAKLDMFIIQKMRIAFGNRIIMQLKKFVPVYVACGGDEVDGIDYILCTKVFRKFESLNLALMRDELKELSGYLTKTFGNNKMKECKAYIDRLQNLY